jgi:hypothetical protein
MRMGRWDARLGPVAWAGAEASWWRSFVVCTRVAQEGPLTGRADAAEMNPEWCIADILCSCHAKQALERKLGAAHRPSGCL